jgi:hypothetical protein
MANIKELIQSIESLDSSFDEKLEALNQMEETLVAMRQQEETAVQENVDLIVEAIKVMEDKVNAQLEIAKSIVPEKGDKGDKGLDGKQGKDGRNGKDGKDGINGKDGADGKDGVSVTDAKIDFDGSLVITLSTGQEINVGEVVAPELQEKIKLVTSGGAGTVLPSQTGNANKYLKTDGTALSWATVSGGSGTVTSVGGTGTVNGITLTGTVTSSGNLTLGGTLGSIGNSQLTNSSITFGSTSQALGSTVSGLSGVTIDNGAVGGTTPAAVTATTLIGGGGSANYGQLTGGATTKAVQFQTLGSDGNVSLAIQPKGTGAIDLAAGSSGVNISNGGTVTAITRTASGGPSYTTVPSVTLSAPTTAGGVQATASATMFVSTATVSAGGSGYLVGDVLTASGGTFSQALILTVATLSGSAVATVTITNAGQYTALPSNPVSITGGTGTGATFTLGWGVNTIVVGNAGSGYVEQPTVTFSSGSATAYATVGSTTTIKSLATTLSFYTPAGQQVQINDGGGDGGNYWRLQGAASTGGVQLLATGTGSTTPALYSTKSTAGHTFYTNTFAQAQFVVSHTASAVNYVQVTGAATGAISNILFTGSDSAVTGAIYTKGTGSFSFYSGAGTNRQVRIDGTTTAVNYLDFYGSIAGSAPSVRVGGSDTDIDLTLTPKNAGAVRFGTYTASSLLPVAGYITIKDSGGTTRRLLVG